MSINVKEMRRVLKWIEAKPKRLEMALWGIRKGTKADEQ
jgi:hypothetical protein